MFGKLKDKLKNALRVFSKKTEEEAEITEVSQEKEVISEKETPTEKNIEVKVKAARKEEQEGKKEGKKKKKQQKKAYLKEVQEPEIKTELEVKGLKEVKGPKTELISKKVNAEKVEEKPPADEIILKTSSQPEVIEEKKEEMKAEAKPSFFGRVKRLFKKKEEQEIIIAKESVASKVEEKPAEEPKAAPPQKKEEQKQEEIPEEKTSFFSKVKQTLTTKTISAEKFEELFWDLEVALLENNVSVSVIEKVKNNLQKELVDRPLPRDVQTKIEETLRQTMEEVLSSEKIDLLQKAKEKKPYVIAFFGINGAGKTTSIAKVTHYFKQHGHSIVLAACDTFRAAAIQQLQEHADALGVKVIKHDYGADAAAVAFDAVRYAEKNKIDVVLIDTAGRLHSNTNLMAELEKIIRVTKPDLKLFVGESITGNDCVEQAQRFNELVEMDGIILTKADVDDKGGAPLSISYVIKKPILFLGVGQKYEDLEQFEKEKILERLGI